MIRLATSSWTLHQSLGGVWYEPDGRGGLLNKGQDFPAKLSLPELPAFIAKDGIRVLEICHFHFPSLDDVYLAELKASLDEAGVKLANVLVDTGNLSSPDEAQWQADLAMTKGWQVVAAELGATGARIDCGLEPATPEAIGRSAAALRALADHGAGLGLETTTENWRTTSRHPEDLLAILRQAERPIKLCVDFGNAAHTADKYQTMAALLPHATSLHCKGVFHHGELDVVEFQRCLSLVKEANFSGHVALIDDGQGDTWQNAMVLKEQVLTFFPDVVQTVV